VAFPECQDFSFAFVAFSRFFIFFLEIFWQFFTDYFLLFFFRNSCIFFFLLLELLFSFILIFKFF